MIYASMYAKMILNNCNWVVRIYKTAEYLYWELMLNTHDGIEAVTESKRSMESGTEDSVCICSFRHFGLTGLKSACCLQA